MKRLTVLISFVLIVLIFTARTDAIMLEASPDCHELSILLYKDFQNQDTGDTIRVIIKMTALIDKDIKGCYQVAKEKHKMLIVGFENLNWKDYYDLYVSEFIYDTRKEKQAVDNKYDLLKLNSSVDLKLVFDSRRKSIVMNSYNYLCNQDELWNRKKYRGKFNDNAEVNAYFKQICNEAEKCVMRNYNLK